MRWPGLWVAVVLGLGATPLAAEALELSFDELRRVPDLQTGQDMINIRLTPGSRAQFAEFTAARIGQRVFIGADGVVLISPVVQTAISGGVILLLPDAYDKTGLSTDDIIAKLKAAGSISVSD